MILNMVWGRAGGDVDKSQIIVTAESGSTVTCTNGTDVRTAREDNGTWRFTGLDNGEWTVTATKGDMSASKTVTIDRLTVLYVSIVYRLVPDFTYTGEYALVNDDDTELTDMGGNWKLRLLTSRTLTFTEMYGWDGTADAFLVGGGGGSSDSAGGAGGYTATFRGVSTEENVGYDVEIGAGGASEAAGGASKIEALGVSVDGGAKIHNRFQGANGGSGGAGYGNGGNGDGYISSNNLNGGSDGSKGGSMFTTSYPGGTGQGTTTREFSDETGTLYAGGGGGRFTSSASGRDGKGGAGGGGDAGYDAAANTGGGAGAGNYNKGGKKGGSGIVIIRNRREVTA